MNQCDHPKEGIDCLNPDCHYKTEPKCLAECRKSSTFDGYITTPDPVIHASGCPNIETPSMPKCVCGDEYMLGCCEIHDGPVSQPINHEEATRFAEAFRKHSYSDRGNLSRAYLALKKDQQDWRKGVELIASSLDKQTLSCSHLAIAALELRADRVELAARVRQLEELIVAWYDSEECDDLRSMPNTEALINEACAIIVKRTK